MNMAQMDLYNPFTRESIRVDYEEETAAAPAPADPAETAAAIRRQRDALLRGSDWTQLADAPVDHAAWALYRQQLRDLPKQPGFPEAIGWPAEP